MIVADANVVLSAVRSPSGASRVVLRAMLSGEIRFAASPAVVLEYEDLLKRPESRAASSWIDDAGIDSLLDALCAQAIPVVPWFRFRPFLADPKDDLYVECALAAGSRTIVTHDRHFRHAAVQAFGLDVCSPGEYASKSRPLRRPR